MKKLLFFWLVCLTAYAQKPIPQSQVIGLPQAFTLINSRLAGHDSQLLTLLPTSLFNSYTLTVTNALGGKVDASVFTSYTAGVATSIANTNTSVATNATNLANYIASNNTALGGKVNNTRTITINGQTFDLGADRTFTVSANYTLPTASASVLGGVKIGANLSVDNNGILSATTPSGGSSVWGTNGSSAYYTAGNVGIGTNSPASLFYVKTNGTGYQSYLTAEAPSGDKLFTYFNSNSNVWQWDTYNSNDQTRKGVSFMAPGGNAGFAIGDNVTPTRTLDVGGIVRSRTGGFEFPDGTVQTSAASGGGSSGFPAQLGTLVTTLTSAGIQAAINAASAGATLVLSGNYDCSGGAFEINKKIKLVSYNKATLDGGTGNSMITKIYSCTGTSISGITFKSSNTGSGYALILINEQGGVSDLSITNNEFTAPVGNTYNAITGNAYSSGSGTGVFHNNWIIRNNYFHDLNRMGVELNNNSSDGTIRYTNIDISDNTFINLGTVDSYDGMAISFSGQMKKLKANNNTIDEFKGYGIEFIQSIDFEAVGNNIYTTKLFNGSNGSNAYNLTDGGATEGQSRPNIGANHGNITGGTIRVPGRPFVFYYAHDVSVNGGYYYAGQAINVQNSKAISLTGLQVESLYQSCLRFDYSSYCTVSGGRYSTENATGGKYEQIGFFGTATGNSVVGSSLFGTSDNGVNIKQDTGVTGNKWANVFFNGAYQSN